MTLYFKKAKNFDRYNFFEEFELDLRADLDIYTIVGIDDDIDEDVITSSEAGFAQGYLSA
ncbi:hypothetical protein HY772_02880 [Candidatus Woesearchaeota archaeon]|nr:hypothetical protein [Candidatus Woesearchaeota archaeon]